MKLLIIGSSGQVARSLLEKQPAFITKVVALEPPQLDLTEPNSIDKAVEDNCPDIIVNAAAYTAVDKAEEDEALAFAINRDGPAHLAKVCARRDIPLIHISTDYVFDGSKAGFYTEEDPASPLGVYGVSKYEGDQAVVAATPKHIILRTAWVFSPFGNNFAKTMLNLAQSRDELNVVDDQRGSPSYAPHIADAIFTIIDHLRTVEGGKEPWGIYNLAGTGEASWCEFAREIFACSKELAGPSATAHAITTNEYPTPAKRPANSRLDCSKLSQIFSVSLPDWRLATKDCVVRLLDSNLKG